MKEELSTGHPEEVDTNLFDAFNELVRVNDMIEGVDSAIAGLAAQFARATVSPEQYYRALQVASDNLEYLAMRKAILERAIAPRKLSTIRRLAHRALGSFGRLR